jgi:hypothetical protein
MLLAHLPELNRNAIRSRCPNRLHLVQGGEHCPLRHRGNTRGPRVQGWHAFGSTSLLFSSHGLQYSSLSFRGGGGCCGSCSKKRRKIMRHEPGSEVREPSGDCSTARLCCAVGFNKRDSKGLGVPLLCSQAARARWADATEVLFVGAAKFACWTSNSALASALPVSNCAANADSRSSLAACSVGEYWRQALNVRARKQISCRKPALTVGQCATSSASVRGRCTSTVRLIQTVRCSTKSAGSRTAVDARQLGCRLIGATHGSEHSKGRGSEMDSFRLPRSYMISHLHCDDIWPHGCHSHRASQMMCRMHGRMHRFCTSCDEP